MRFALRLCFSCFCQVGFSQIAQEHRTFVVPLPHEEIQSPCEYRLTLPETEMPVRAIWVIFDRGQDYLKWYEDRQVRAFAREHRLALVLAMHCRSKEREDMIVEPEKGVGRALFAAFDQFAAKLSRPDLRVAPIIAMGWSGAGSLAARLAGYRPARYLAGISYAPGQYDPLGMDTIQLSRAAISAPQLIIANGGDNINGTERPYEYFKKYFERGAPWTFVVQNRTPHCCLQNVQLLVLDWVHAILAMEPKLFGRKEQGYFTPELSQVTDEWKRPVFNAKLSRIGAKGKIRSKELPSGWLPSPTFAETWLAFMRRATPVAVWRP